MANSSDPKFTALEILVVSMVQQLNKKELFVDLSEQIELALTAFRNTNASDQDISEIEKRLEGYMQLFDLRA